MSHSELFCINIMAHVFSFALFFLLLGNYIFESHFIDLPLISDNCSATCKSGSCIYEDWICDNEADCVDGSDELNCGNRTCSSGHILCLRDNQCIPEMWKCDGVADCPDGEDEKDCKENSCENEFQCKDNKKCISIRWRCDFEPDCDDGSDEEDCEGHVCPEFTCSNGRCIESAWRCDGDIDCMDRSDERNCTYDTNGGPNVHHDKNDCEADSFKCVLTGECINKAWRCDGDPDCLDHSDENVFTCSMLGCKSGQFACADNKTCVPDSLRCDSNNDCLDGSDEVNCPPVYKCTENQFDCTGQGDNCVDVTYLCNGHDDCGDRQDEADEICNRPGCKEHNNNNCSHTCVDLLTHLLCTCPRGMQLSKDDKTCEDLNECLNPSTCSHICINKPDGKGFKCLCHPGYELDPNIHRCKATGDEPMLLFANRHDVREIRLRSGLYKSIMDHLHSAVAIDYDYSDQMVYWSDVREETISRLSLQESNTITNELVEEDVSTPDGLALDWVHKNLYWTDTGKNRIEVMSVLNPDDAPWRMVLFSDKLDEPRAIVVDPRPGRWSVFWTDWGHSPKIERSYLDGSERRVIVSTNIQWPNGLTIDYEIDRIYWVDAKCHSIFSSNFDGEDRHLIITSEAYIRHPFAMTVFEDDIYWSDWETESIHKVPRYFSPERARNKVTPVAIWLHSPMGVHVYHRLKQPIVENVCKNSNCQHLCLPRNSRRAGGSNYTCACSSRGGYRLGANRKSCYPTSPVSKYLSPPTHNKAVLKVVKTSTKMLRKHINENPENSVVDSSVSHRQMRTVGLIICFLAVIIIIIIISISFVVYRSYMRKVPKVLNFDNPVYRRTTDDTLVLQRNNKSSLPSPSSLLQPLTALNNDQTRNPGHIIIIPHHW